jgi:hypothetical protein
MQWEEVMRRTGLVSRLGCLTMLLMICMPGMAGAQQTAPEKTAPEKTVPGAAPQKSKGESRAQPPEAGKTHKQFRPEYVRKERETTYDVTLVSVVQLEEALREGQHMHDGALADELAGLVLTERLSSAKLKAWEAALHGNKSRQELVALADASAFLDPPATEIPGLERPNLVDQKKMVAKAVDYLSKSIRNLPGLVATRTITRYENWWEIYQPDGPVVLGGQAWHKTGATRNTVLYQNGEEIVEPGASPRKREKAARTGLAIRGTFGPILSTVMVDIAHGRMVWSRWEQGANGPEAVFRYSVPEKESHYGVEYNSVAGDQEKNVLHRKTAYHGEIAIDPSSGVILRLTLMADLPASQALVQSDIMVEYSPVELGGKTYSCPTRSVAISGARARANDQTEEKEGPGPEVTILNDVAFGQCRLYQGGAGAGPGK